MNILKKTKALGFSLIEMMLVAGIISGFLVMGAKYIQQRAQVAALDRASLQMQQILNAGLSYYVNNGKWPTALSDLQTGGYLPAAPVILKSPWGTDYTAQGVAAPGAPPQPLIVFSVTVTLPATMADVKATAKILAGKLPFGVSTSSAPYTVTASVNVPGQNLNNAPSVNFAALYHNGACVPQPVCPVDQTGAPTTPEILVVPVSASGMNDAGSLQTYPITSVTAYATGTAGTPGNPPGCGGGVVPDCTGLTPSGLNYWRVCLRVITTKGVVDWDATTATGAPNPGLYTAEFATVMAMTRCAMTNEPSGSAFTVFGE